MKVDEIIVEGPIGWAKNKAKIATNYLGNKVGLVSDRKYNTAKFKNEIDVWSKQVLSQWASVEAGLENSVGPLSAGNAQEYADQLSKWLKNYFRLSGADLANYSTAIDGALGDDNILKYIKKAYAVRMSPSYLDKVSGRPNGQASAAPSTIKALIPGKTTAKLALPAGGTVDVSLMWVGADGSVIKDASLINQINSTFTWP